MRSRRLFAVLLLSASLGLAGCAADASDSGDAQTAAKPAARDAGEGAAGPGYAADEAAGQPEQADADRKAPAKQAPAQAHVIRTAALEVEVENATKALAAARTTALNAGGHVENETTERIDETHVTSHVVIRVPQEQYDSVLTELAGAGKLLARKANAKDVTDQVVDVESRIATQRASVARVRELMDRATKLADVVTLEGELSSRQADLESLLAQQSALKDRTSMATITLTLSEQERPKADKDDDPGFLDALGGGWDALTATLRWSAVVIGAVAPFAAVAVVLYAVWRWLVRPRLPRRTAAAPAVSTAVSTAVSPATED
jgi:hypothetical protein